MLPFAGSAQSGDSLQLLIQFVGCFRDLHKLTVVGKREILRLSPAWLVSCGL
jgi:hypothetical protein